MTSSGEAFSSEHKTILLQVAAASLEHGLRHGSALTVAPPEYPHELQLLRAVFVTLRLDDELRGCVGTLDAELPLIANVAKYAYAAGFRDSRFPSLTWPELSSLRICLSVLSPLEPITYQSEAELLGQIRPGIDGLFLEEGAHRGTLLPSVWEDLPEAGEFLRRLKMKAGLPPHYWSPTVVVRRYTTTCVAKEP
jgi:AmmeMemoRadiSam system protein A